MSFEGRFQFQSSYVFPPPRKRVITVFQYPRDYSTKESIDLGIAPSVDETKSCTIQKNDFLETPPLPPPAISKPAKPAKPPRFKKPAILPKPTHLEKSSIDEKEQNEKCSESFLLNENKNPLQNGNETMNAQNWKINPVNSHDLSHNSIHCNDEEHLYADCCCKINDHCSESHHLDLPPNMEVKHSYFYGENGTESDKIQNHLNIIVSEYRERSRRSLPFKGANEDSSKNEVTTSNQRRSLQVVNIRPRASSHSPPRRSPGGRNVRSTYSFRINPKSDVTMYRKIKCTCQSDSSTFDPSTRHSCRCRSPLPAISSSCPTSPWMDRAADQHSLAHIERREFISPSSPTPSSKSNKKRMFSGKDLMKKIYSHMKEKKNTVGSENSEILEAWDENPVQDPVQIPRFHK